MDVDVGALQLLPEADAPGGLKKPQCMPETGTRVGCLDPTCIVTQVVTISTVIG